MRIIKNGSIKPDTTHFVCKNCGCEFECDKDECWSSDIVLTTYPPQHTIYTCCPQCHKKCTTYVTDKIDTYKVTLTGDMVDGTKYCK